MFFLINTNGQKIHDFQSTYSFMIAVILKSDFLSISRIYLFLSCPKLSAYAINGAPAVY